VTRFRIRHGDKQIGPWWPTVEQAEQAAVELKLAHHDTQYDVLILAPDVEIDGEDGDAADEPNEPAAPR
jgi:hypothetical protein